MCMYKCKQNMNYSDLPYEVQDHVRHYVAKDNIKSASYINFVRDNPIYRIIMDGAVGYKFTIEQVQKVRNNLKKSLKVEEPRFRTRYESLFEYDMKCAELYRNSEPSFVQALAAQQARMNCFLTARQSTNLKKGRSKN